MRENKGFSLIELIIVIAIMAILVGVLAPNFVKYIGKARRSVDIHNASEYANACQRGQIFNECAAPTETEYYQGNTPSSEEATGIWSCGFRYDYDGINMDNPQDFLDYFCAEIGCIPVSKTNSDFFWYIKYNRYTMEIVKIYLVDGEKNKLYEVYPDGSDFLANGP